MQQNYYCVPWDGVSKKHKQQKPQKSPQTVIDISFTVYRVAYSVWRVTGANIRENQWPIA